MESDGRLTGKELMVKWCPEQSKVKSKMTFASSAKGLNDSLNVSYSISDSVLGQQ